MAKRDDDRRTPAAPAKPFHDPFGGLAERLGMPPSPGGDAAPGAAPARGEALPTRAVVRLERRRRGGKEVTVVEKLDLTAGDRQRWLLDLKRALGCGGAVEGDALVLQGDLRARVKAWLEERGVRKVTLG